MPDHSIFLAGFGNIGQAVAELVATGHPAADGVRIVGVCDPRYGTVVVPEGLDAATLLRSVADRGSFDGLDGVAKVEVFAAIDHSRADTLVELTFTDLVTGEPATSHIRHALSHGLNVSTTNKGPIALHLSELEDLAESNGVSISYEGTVMSGTPTLLIAAGAIRNAGFRSATGILNGTTNYIICRMEDGASYDDALAEAQEHGYAEADPSGDVEGRDPAGKLSILAKVLADTAIAPSDVERVPLSTLTASDVASAQASGQRWRYIAALAPSSGTSWSAVVAPRRIDAGHPLASVTGPTNAITFDTDLLGEVTISGPGAGRQETAYSVLSDLARIRERQL